jgi:hypothetical protein
MVGRWLQGLKGLAMGYCDVLKLLGNVPSARQDEHVLIARLVCSRGPGAARMPLLGCSDGRDLSTSRTADSLADVLVEESWGFPLAGFPRNAGRQGPSQNSPGMLLFLHSSIAH